MFSDTLAIQVKDVNKCYQIYDTPRDRLKQFFLPRLQRVARATVKSYFKEFWALQAINLQIKRGETVGIVGRNGSGKSTLLQIICGTLAPTSGEVNTSGRVAALLELGSGFNPEFTGRENVYLNGSLLGLSREQIDEKYDAISDFADIGEFIDRPIKTYSSGMVVRLAFAVAIHSSPQILVIDEALSVGDELFQRKCFSHISRIKNEGATILFVSHSGSTVIDLCDRAVLIDSGRQLIEAHPKAVIGLYQKLMYASPEKAEYIKEQVVSGGVQNFDPKDGFEEAVKPFELNDDVGDYYDASLISKSEIRYEASGAIIERARITDELDREVNCLVSGRYYVFNFEVLFSEGAANVFFGMLIKTVSGIELGGGVSSGSTQDRIPYVEKGSRFVVRFNFRCALNPGTYFLNAGVVGARDLEEGFLHRVLDAYSFRVLRGANTFGSGLVDFSCNPEIIQLDDQNIFLP